MKKIMAIGMMCCLVLSAQSSEFLNPLPNDFKSKENGGVKDAIDAYSDGVGVVVGDNKVNNTAMNMLVFKYGQTAKENGVTVKEQVLYSESATPSDIALASALPELQVPQNMAPVVNISGYKVGISSCNYEESSLNVGESKKCDVATFFGGISLSIVGTIDRNFTVTATSGSNTATYTFKVTQIKEDGTMCAEESILLSHTKGSATTQTIELPCR